MAVLQQLRRYGINLDLRGDGVVLTPASAVSDDVRALVKANKPQLLDQLRRIVLTEPIVEFRWGKEDVAVELFEPGMETGLGGLVCLDCETTLIEKDEIPSLIMLAASDGIRHFVVQARDLVGFVQQHSDRHVVFHNAAFDFWVVRRRLDGSKALPIRRDWDRMLKEDQFHDTMLLDRLLRIAGTDPGTGVGPRDLAKVAARYAQLELSKDDPYRTRYGEIRGKCLTTVDPGFIEYGIKDAIATVRSFAEMHAVALQVMENAGFDRYGNTQETYTIRPDAQAKFGLLTEAIQVKSSIAFSLVTRNGFSTCKEKRSQLKNHVGEELARRAHEIDCKFPGIFRKDRDGDFKRTKKGQQPSENQVEIRNALFKSCSDFFGTGDDDIPKDKRGQVSIRREDWNDLLDQVEFAQEWFEYKGLCKINQAIPSLDEDRLHPKYDILKVTGRTGCSRPNMQNIPREDEFRQIIVPSKGNLLLAVDYSFVELVTLAATCRCRYGVSKLGDLIEQGKDPHCFTASILLEQDLDDFMRLKVDDPEQFKLWRQRAKPINFGVPGGMSVKSLVEYARIKYGVGFTIEQAQEFSRKLTEETYPELQRYLTHDEMESLAKSLCCSSERAWSVLDFTGERPGWLPHTVKKIVAGNLIKSDGTPYSQKFIDGVWGGLLRLNRNPELNSRLQHRSGSESLSELLFNTFATTMTGRVRSPVTYTVKRNTPFQGLASDGAKLAVADLVFSGYRVVGFVHDEILVELPDQGGFVSKRVFDKVIRTVRRGMEKVTSGVPVQCEATLSTCWSKRAKLIVEGDKVFAWSPE